MLASELVTRALRLINVPGRGGVLGSFDQQQAFETLQEILDSEAVSKLFVPGIRRHFFSLVANEHIYSYGPDGDFDTIDFDDPVPTKIEDAYISAGNTIVRNERVDEWDFKAAGIWTIGGILSDGFVTLADVESVFQVLPTPLVVGTRYIAKIDYTQFTDELRFRVQEGFGPTDLVNQVLTESGEYEFEYVVADPANHQVSAAGVTTPGSHRIDSISIIEKGKERVELAGFGSDYSIKVIDQRRYNRRFSKGTGGRPYQLLYSRNYPTAEVRFDNAPTVGDTIVMDVLVNRVAITSLDSEIRMHPDAIKWLRYEIADHEAGAFGKMLSPRQTKILDAAYDKLAAGNLRTNMLAVPRALRTRPIFDINRGDP